MAGTDDWRWRPITRPYHPDAVEYFRGLYMRVMLAGIEIDAPSWLRKVADPDCPPGEPPYMYGAETTYHDVVDFWEKYLRKAARTKP